ncbi:MAG: cell envelope integrity protein CreD [Flavobacteriales bacterium]|nr:cell envelope integrity protein CreD [Flavobacteriales bacterium]MCB9448213.1 cell envelope integrity protein CreD [Flavobacteriales bacterium]
MTQESTIPRIKEEIKHSITLRLFSIAVLILLMLIPMAMIMSIINEREYRKEEAIREVSDKWGTAQTVTGPVLVLPYLTYINRDGVREPQGHAYAYFLPDRLDVSAKVDPEIRKRGMYQVALYRSGLNLTGSFSRPDVTQLGLDPNDVIWNEATIAVGIKDMSGLQQATQIEWNRKPITLEPGLTNSYKIPDGLANKVPIDSLSQRFDFNMELALRGSQNLRLVPVGKETQVNLDCNWPDPKFNGAILPDSSDITDTHTAATWKVLHVNRNYPQAWKDSSQQFEESAFGVDLYIPLDEYQKSMRSAKYAILILSLTFVLFFGYEVFNKKRIHPIQYLLVGLALSIFYVLLVSLSEHLSFNPAYVISSIAVISLITVYAHGALQNKKAANGMGGSLALLYGFIFLLLQSEDYALLIGSIGLFIVLAGMMYFSRKVDWYELAKGKKSKIQE